MSDCWRCTQKAAWKTEKLNKARQDAKELSKKLGKTIAIIQNGCLYQVIENYHGLTVKEYINAANSS